jgi:light-regulated signal transduction histidine kinase (bacteriophytochrome)
MEDPAANGGVVYLNANSLHDLVGPINQLCSIAEMMLTRYSEKLDGEAAVLLGFVQNSASRLRTLLDGLKTYFEIVDSPRAYCHCDADLLLSGALASLHPRIAEADAVVTRDVLPALDCDPRQVTFLFASLIDNAIKFRGVNPPHIHVAAASAQDKWVISVRDNGIGIDPRHHKSIFGVFNRVYNDRYPGAGVGLAIAMRIVERHKGNIRVDSAVGEGTAMIVELPRNPGCEDAC